MSCYEWEAGTIQLPKSQFAKIRKQFIEGYNAIMLDQLERSKKLREYVLTANKGKRNVDWSYVVGNAANQFGVEWNTMGKMLYGTDKGKPKNLNKKMMELANSKTFSFDIDGSGHITFDPEAKTVTYSVYENNHACETAREAKVGQLFFRIMGNINWTRGSGGSLYGNDEYNRHESHGGAGGGNYVTATWPAPKVDKRRYMW